MPVAENKKLQKEKKRKEKKKESCSEFWKRTKGVKEVPPQDIRNDKPSESGGQENPDSFRKVLGFLNLSKDQFFVIGRNHLNSDIIIFHDHVRFDNQFCRKLFEFSLIIERILIIAFFKYTIVLTLLIAGVELSKFSLSGSLESNLVRDF